MARYCSSCGAEMVDTAAFCPKCGKPTGIQPTAAPSPAASLNSVPTSPVTASGTTGLQDNIAGLLAYLVLPAIVFLILEPYSRNRFIRFHSVQGVALWVVYILASAVISAIPILNFLLLPLVGFAFLIIAVICMIKAFQNQTFKLPLLGEFAEKHSNP